jgi:hypothetical protein
MYLVVPELLKMEGMYSSALVKLGNVKTNKNATPHNPASI